MDVLLGFLVAMSVTMALIPPLMRLAVRFDFLDAPGQRKVHATPIPRVGGIAMAAGMLLAFVLSNDYAQPMPAYLAGVVVLLAFGVCDDRFTLQAGPKFLGQILAVVLAMVWGDVNIGTLTLLERHLLPDWVSMPLTFVFLLGVTNAINLADGLDGLAGGTTLLSLSALALLAFGAGNPFVAVVAIIIMGAILGFLRFNTHPARVFMGDAGSQILGFSAGVLAIELTQDPAAPLSAALPLLLLGIPIVDTLMVMTQRMLAGKSPFHADRNHIHHRLLALGFDHHEAVVAIYVLQGGLFIVAWFLRFESDLTIVAAFAVFSIAAIALLQLSARAGWRWRRAQADGSLPASRLAQWARWLRSPEHLPRWALVTIAAITATFFIVLARACPVPNDDVRALSVLLALLLAALTMKRWRQETAGWLMKTALYVAAVMAMYFDHRVATWLEAWPPGEWLLFGLLMIAILLRFRFAADRRFRLTPLDVLVLFVAIALPNLPGAIAGSQAVGVSIVKLMAVLYGIEMLLEASGRWWRVPAVAALAFVTACAVCGMF